MKFITEDFKTKIRELAIEITACNTKEPRIYIESKNWSKIMDSPMTADEIQQLGEWLVDTALGIKNDSDFKNK